MAVYVTSDAHGHVRALDAALSQVSLADDDALFVLGDMVDRGPDPMGVVNLVRGLPNAHVLLGNHEMMMLEALASPDRDALELWALNGGFTTLEGITQLTAEETSELIDWARALPLYAIVSVGERDFVLVHAGVNPERAAGMYTGTLESLDEMLRAQTVEDLVWIRGEFWGQPTGLINRQGKGPQVIAGHTPTVLLENFAYQPCEPMTDEEGRGKIVELGATWDTGGVPDRINIDCSAAAGAGQGRVGILRLDDGARFYAAIEEGE